MPALVACSLAMFAGGDGRDRTQSTSNFEPPDRDPIANDFAQAAIAAEPDPIEAIVPPESFSVRFLVDPGPMPYTVLGATPVESFSVARLVEAGTRHRRPLPMPMQSASLPQTGRSPTDRVKPGPFQNGAASPSAHRPPITRRLRNQLPPAIAPPERWTEFASVPPEHLPSPQHHQTRFSDIQTHWAQHPIQILAMQGIVRGFPDRSFRPDTPIVQAQFTTLLHRAFPQGRVTSAASQHGSGSPSQHSSEHQTERPMSRLQVLIAVLDRLASSGVVIPNLDRDRQYTTQRPNTTDELIQTAMAHHLIAGFPKTGYLHLTRTATRADVAALILRALDLADQTVVPSRTKNPVPLS